MCRWVAVFRDVLVKTYRCPDEFNQLVPVFDTVRFSGLFGNRLFQPAAEKNQVIGGERRRGEIRELQQEQPECRLDVVTIQTIFRRILDEIQFETQFVQRNRARRHNLRPKVKGVHEIQGVKLLRGLIRITLFTGQRDEFTRF